MSVKPFLPTILAPGAAAVRVITANITGRDAAQDLGRAIALPSQAATVPQISMATERGGSVATEGKSGMPVTGPSVQVEDVDQVHCSVASERTDVACGRAEEPSGVPCFNLFAPAGRLPNVLEHRDAQRIG